MTGSIVNNTDGAVIIESNATENNNWLWKENAKAWGLFWFNRGTQSGQTIGGYTTIGAELMFMGESIGIAMPSGWTGYYSTSKIAAMISNYNGYIYSASTIYAATSMVVAGNTVLHAGNYNSYAVAGAGYSTNQNLNTSNNVTFSTINSNNGYSFVAQGYNNSGGFAMNNASTYWGLMWNYASNDWRLGYGSTTAQQGWNLRWDNGGTVWANASMRAPIFYDSDNTGYYGDFASTSNFNALKTASYEGNANVGGTGNAAWFPSGMYSGGTQWLYGTMYRNNAATYDQGDIVMASNTGINYSSTHWLRPRDSSGNMHLKAESGGIYLDAGIIHFRNAAGGADTTISSGRLNFGDSGSTPYANPTGTSVGISFGGWESSSLRTYGIFTELENVGGNYSKLTFNYHTGIRFGASSSYGGTRFYNNYVGSGSETFSINNGDNHVRVAYNLYVGGTISGSNLSGTNTGDQTNISGKADGALKLWAASHPNDYYIVNNWTGTYWQLTTNHGSGVQVAYANSAGSASSAGSAGYLSTAYAGGQQTNPQVYFNNGVGLKAAMTGAWSVWSDTLWINGYSGGDVLQMCALHTLRNGTPRMAISVQASTSTSYGAFYEFITTYNIASQSVSYATTAGSAPANGGTASNVAWSGVTSKPAGWLDTTNLIIDNAPVDAVPSGFYQNYNGSGNPTGTWFNYINVRHSNPGNGHGFQIGMSYYDTNLWFRSYQGGLSPTYSAWSYAISSLNIGSQSVSYASSSGNSSTTSQRAFSYLRVNSNDHLYLDYNYGCSIVGTYSSYRFQGVYSMGSSWGLAIDGTSPGNLYGLSWSHPNAGGQASRLNDHGLMVMINGVTQSAFSSNIWAAGDITAYSDARVKENVEVIENALEKIQAIRGVTFTRNDMTDITTRHAGVIAQEVLEVLPEVITKDANDHYSVAYGNLNALLIEAIKEQQLQIEELKNKLDNVLSSR
jgi:hypothetical protein